MHRCTFSYNFRASVDLAKVQPWTSPLSTQDRTNLKLGPNRKECTPRITWKPRQSQRKPHTSWPDYLGSFQHLFPLYCPKDFRKVSLSVSDFFKYTIKEKGLYPCSSQNMGEKSSRRFLLGGQDLGCAVQLPPQQEIYSLDNPGLFLK